MMSLMRKRICATSCMVQLHHGRATQSTRLISTTYILDMVLQRRNPLIGNMENLSVQENLSLNDDGTKATGNLHSIIPKLSSKSLEPFHGRKAATEALETFDREMENLRENYEGRSDAEFLCEELDRMLQPVMALRFSLMLMSNVTELSKKFQWERELQDLIAKQAVVDKKHAPWVYKALEDATKSASDEISTSATILRNHLESLYAPNLCHDEENLERFAKLSKAIESTGKSFVADSENLSASKESIGLMYNVIGLLHDRCELLGYDSFASQVWAQNRRMARPAEVEDIIKSTVEQLQPFIASLYGQGSKSAEEEALDDLLRPTQPDPTAPKPSIADPNSDPILQDEMIQLRFQDHVTLAGTMDFLGRLVSDVFGVKLVKEEKCEAWADGVELYHLFDNHDSRHLASFYLDPFSRSGKVEEVCTCPLQVRGKTAVPVLAILLQAETPTWNDDPTAMKWDDIKALFHELGHVLQEALADSKFGATLGSQDIPRDLTEVLPHFMEHWLLEKSTLYGLIACSKTDAGFAHDQIDAFYRVLSRKKAEELSIVAYFSAVELEIFSAFDLRGSESIMACQQRLAEQIVPHDMPHKSDLTPLIRAIQPNASGDPICHYTYLWADCFAAHIFEGFRTKYSEDGGTHDSNTFSPLRAQLLKHGAMMQPENIRREWAIEQGVPTSALFKRYKIGEGIEESS